MKSLKNTNNAYPGLIDQVVSLYDSEIITKDEAREALGLPTETKELMVKEAELHITGLEGFTKLVEEVNGRLDRVTASLSALNLDASNFANKVKEAVVEALEGLQAGDENEKKAEDDEA